MRTVGIIVEYNPLHNGHVHHFAESRRVTGAEAVVAVMSGHFLQRGEPAIVNKWTRAEMALRMGADLVIELPVLYSVQPAEWFAYGAVSALHRTGVVDAICFGSESGDIEWLNRLSAAVAREPDSFQAELRSRLKTGMNFPRAYSTAIGEWLRMGSEREGSPDNQPVSVHDLMQPNNTLGLHYLIALRRLNSPIRAYTITRAKAGYNDAHVKDSSIASATAIRRIIGQGGGLDGVAPYVPPFTLELMAREFREGRGPVDWERFARPLFHQLVTMQPSQLAEMYEVSEGLENRIIRSLAEMDPEQAPTVSGLLERLKTKRYTLTKLQRMLARILLGHTRRHMTKARLRAGVSYLRVLGFSEAGRELLKQMRKSASVPVVVNVSGHPDNPDLELDVRASAVYALAYDDPRAGMLLQDYRMPPIRI
jgi:predicted nucleotidyltransferase